MDQCTKTLSNFSGVDALHGVGVGGIVAGWYSGEASFIYSEFALHRNQSAGDHLSLSAFLENVQIFYGFLNSINHLSLSSDRIL